MLGTAQAALLRLDLTVKVVAVTAPMRYAKTGHAFALEHDGRRVAQGGELQICDLPAETLKLPVSYVDFDIDMLAEITGSKVPASYRPTPGLLEVHKDLAIIVDAGTPWEKIEAVVRATIGTQLKEVRPFDIYEHESIGAGKKSIAMRLHLSSMGREKSFTSDELQDILQRTAAALADRLRAEQRGPL